MITKRFNPEKDLAPMPFDERICLHALEMKNSGLVWRPHVGCFVWDPNEIIKPASPFPGRIYFILSLSRFIDIFGSIDQISSKLVWLPTWHQARLVYQQLEGPDSVIGESRPEGHAISIGEELLHIYELIIKTLKTRHQKGPSEI